MDSGGETRYMHDPRCCSSANDANDANGGSIALVCSCGASSNEQTSPSQATSPPTSTPTNWPSQEELSRCFSVWRMEGELNTGKTWARQHERECQSIFLRKEKTKFTKRLYIRQQLYSINCFHFYKFSMFQYSLVEIQISNFEKLFKSFEIAWCKLKEFVIDRFHLRRLLCAFFGANGKTRR